MFKYQSQSFIHAAKTLESVCRELDVYEEEIRRIAIAWDREPDMPAPRHKLRKSLENLERRETALNLMRRKLESAARIYEAAERRALELAEEEGVGRFPDGAPSYGRLEESPDHFRGRDDIRVPDHHSEIMKAFETLFARWMWPPFRRRRPLPSIIRPLPPGVIPIPAPKPRPWIVVPRPPVWHHPPRRPDSYISQILRDILREERKRRRPGFPGHLPDFTARLPKDLRPPVPCTFPRQSPGRLLRRSRIDNIFSIKRMTVR